MDENKIELTEDRQRWSLEEMEKDFIDYANSFDWSMDDSELEPRMNHGTETTNQINE